MKKKLYWQAIKVAEPCTEEWNEMTGNDQVRFCSHCAKSVNNISEMTRGRAKRLIRKSNGSLCIRYAQLPETNVPVFVKPLTRITRRRTPLMAAGVVGASLSLASLTFAQGGAVPHRAATVERKETSARKRTPPTLGVARINGKINPSAGANGNDALVTLIDKDGTIVRMDKANESGEFGFDIEPGTYTIEAVSQHGVTVTRPNFEAKDGENTVVLELGTEQRRITSGFVTMELPLTQRNPLALVPQTSSPLDDAREMVARGEDVDQKDEDGSTPLFSAIENGDIELVRFLLDHGAKVNVRNDEKETPLMMIDDETPLDIVELLLQRGAKVNRVDSDGDTALIRAVDARAKPEILKALIVAGADLNAQNEDGMTALMTAADENDLESVRLLLEAGADVNLRDTDGDNAWDYATEKEIEDLLVSYGVVLDPEDQEEPASVQPGGIYFDPIDNPDVEIRSDDPDPGFRLIN